MGESAIGVIRLSGPAALASASDILGIEVGDAVLDRIFSTFCLGK